jgi:hypothetical protein
MASKKSPAMTAVGRKHRSAADLKAKQSVATTGAGVLGLAGSVALGAANPVAGGVGALASIGTIRKGQALHREAVRHNTKAAAIDGLISKSRGGSAAAGMRGAVAAKKQDQASGGSFERTYKSGAKAGKTETVRARGTK